MAPPYPARTMARSTRKAPSGSSFELYARAMLDRWLGKSVTVEFEQDDGYRSESKIDSYFTPPSKWPRMEREAIKLVRGRTLDLGCGPGRHAMFLQKKGFDVVGVDASPTQVALARIRGLTRTGGRLIGHSRIPGTWSEDHLPYVKWNVRRGRPPGLLTLRVRYKGRVGDWFDLLLIPPDELAKAAHETGWDLVRVIWEGGYQPGDYVGVLEKR